MTENVYENILEINNVTKKYDNFTLDNVNIKVPKGCIMGYIGANGAGKTTTIKLTLNAIKKDAGNIKIFGKDVDKFDKEIKEDIGVVFDDCHFSDYINAKDVEKIMKNIYKRWNTSLFFEYLDKFGIDKKKKIKEYSKGMKMKLSIAAALAHEPKFLILDEATSGLDPVIRDEVLDIFMEFIQDEERSVFISSHILSDLEKVCDYITFIDKGRIIFSEEKDLVMEKYGILKCSEEEYKNIDKSLILGTRVGEFCVEALIEKSNVGKINLKGTYAQENLVVDNANLEDIMLFFKKGVK